MKENTFARRYGLMILAGVVVGAAALIQSFSQMALTRNAVKDDEDSQETAPLARLVVLACVAAGVAATAAAAVLLAGVRG